MNKKKSGWAFETSHSNCVYLSDKGETLTGLSDPSFLWEILYERTTVEFGIVDSIEEASEGIAGAFEEVLKELKEISLENPVTDTWAVIFNLDGKPSEPKYHKEVGYPRYEMLKGSFFRDIVIKSEGGETKEEVEQKALKWIKDSIDAISGYLNNK